jgi:hypothetical protein
MGQLDTRVWGDDERPELTEALLARTEPVGLCLSGGGTRAMCAGIGQLRGLHALGLLQRTRYLSSVSGGGWAAAPYTFYASGAQTDEGFLGPVASPADLDMDALGETIPESQGNWTATRALNAVFVRAAANGDHHKAWNEAVGQLYLGPWGLHGDTPVQFCDPDSVDAIREHNPGLSSTLVTVRAERPVLVMNSCLVGDHLLNPQKTVSPVPLELSALQAGAPRKREWLDESKTGKWMELSLDGRMVEPFALGCGTPQTEADGRAQADAPEHLYTLADAVGTSSAWFGGLAAKLAPSVEDGFSDRLSLWPSGDRPTHTFDVGDGGVVENYGLLSLLRRGVGRAIVCMNTSSKLNLDYDPSAAVPKSSDLDAYLAPLFGFQVDQLGVFTGRNQVFRPADFVTVVRALQAARSSGGPTVAVTDLELLPNPWWGIEGGRTVRIAWLYLERSSDFEAALPSDTRAQVERGNSNRPAVAKGPLRDFPHYATANQNGPDLTQLTDTQARLLSDYTCWAVMQAREQLESLYD